MVKRRKNEWRVKQRSERWMEGARVAGGREKETEREAREVTERMKGRVRTVLMFEAA